MNGIPMKPNPLFNQLNGNDPNGLQDRFNQFKRTVQGDPKAIVENLVATGQMSQQQFNMLSNLANVYKGSLH